MDIQIANDAGVSAPNVALLSRVARRVCAAEGFREGTLSIAIVKSAAMSRLHRRHAGVSGPTDVLTFDLDTDRRRNYVDGEVVICADVARRANPGQPIAELALYLTHGILHLAGYDDHRAPSFRKMHAREDQLLTKLGVGAVFGRGNSRAG